MVVQSVRSGRHRTQKASRKGFARGNPLVVGFVYPGAYFSMSTSVIPNLFRTPTPDVDPWGQRWKNSYSRNSTPFSFERVSNRFYRHFPFLSVRIISAGSHWSNLLIFSFVVFSLLFQLVREKILIFYPKLVVFFWNFRFFFRTLFISTYASLLKTIYHRQATEYKFAIIFREGRTDFPDFFRWEIRFLQKKKKIPMFRNNLFPEFTFSFSQLTHSDIFSNVIL